jgi:hypothetical protein
MRTYQRRPSLESSMLPVMKSAYDSNNLFSNIPYLNTNPIIDDDSDNEFDESKMSDLRVASLPKKITLVSRISSCSTSKSSDDEISSCTSNDIPHIGIMKSL